MIDPVLTNVLATSIAAATPLLLAALGELVAEKSGVLNLGIEGIMLVGAMTGVAATIGTDSVMLELLSAVVAGAALGLIFAFLTVTIRADHVVAGLAMVLFGDGISSFAGHGLVGQERPRHGFPDTRAIAVAHTAARSRPLSAERARLFFLFCGGRGLVVYLPDATGIGFTGRWREAKRD